MTELIKNWPDKQLQKRINEYFGAFINYDAEGLRACQSEDFTMNDNPLGNVNISRDVLYQIELRMATASSDLKVEVISLQGSSAPDSFAALEWAISWKLKEDMPEIAAHLAPGTKAGDTVHQVGVTLLWWNEHGKVKRHIEHGRLQWDGFNINQVKRI